MATDGNFSPAFWDNLSEVLLTRRALRELDRRNSARSPPKAVQRNVRPSKLARFARHGGPNLNHLRGDLEPKKAIRSKSFSPPPSRCTTSTAPSLDSEDRHSSAYDENFTNHLIDHGIYPEGHEHPDGCATPEPCNLNDTRHELLNPRASLSPTLFTASMFRDFKRNNRADSKGTLMQNVIPMIAGNASTPNEGNIAFTNLTPLTDEATVTAMPDSFDGTRPSEVHSVVKHDLSNLVVPAKHENDPVAPNFFLEAKAPSGSALVVENQACYDGAHGARAIHALQNYGRTESTDNYDGNAYAYSSTYHSGGTLRLYAHHVTAPTGPGEKAEYHMTQLRSFAMTDSRKAFVAGATAFRNARDLAKQHRDSFIQAANARAAQLAPVVYGEAAEIDEASTTCSASSTV